MKIFMTLLVAGTVLLGASPASAYRYNTCGDKVVKWSGTGKTMYPNSGSFPAGYWEDGIRETVRAFNRNPSKFRYGTVMDTGGVGISNGQSEIWGWPGWLIADAPAVAVRTWTCYWLFGWNTWMNEVDVIYNYDSPFRWTASKSKYSLFNYQGSLQSLHTAGAHELGHGLPLEHENTEYNIMGADYSHIHVNGSIANAYIGEDASDAAVFLYGDRGGWQDVGVVHWKYYGPSGEYSSHTRTEIYNSEGTQRVPWAFINGEIGHRVYRGQWVQVEFTYENNGSTNYAGIPVGYYISTNDYISTGDRLISSRSFALGRDNVYTGKRLVQIPTDLEPDTNYWIGVIIDNKNYIAEAVEWNNATYIPIYVQY